MKKEEEEEESSRCCHYSGKELMKLFVGFGLFFEKGSVCLRLKMMGYGCTWERVK